MSDNLDDIPLPEPCTIEDKLVSTRKNLVEEQDGNLFNRKCDNLDNTIPKRKDRFIECEELPEVPKVLLKNKQFNEVEFPGVPLAEIPKKLLAHLLPCCLEGRSAGFDFEAHEELDGNGDKVELDFEDSDNPVTKAFTIQLGTEGFSYFRIGLNIKPELCFCDEDCGDADYIHLKVNFGVEYHDEDDDPIQDPDLVIEDEQLTNLISNFGGGGGGGNPLCAQKLFGQYLGSDVVLDDPDSFSGSFIPYGSYSSLSNNAITAYAAPYLTNFKLIHSGVYKLEYFCEYDKWYITDGQCADVAPRYPFPSYVLVKKSGLPNQTYSGTVVFYTDTMVYPYDDWEKVYDSTDSTLLEAEAFVNGELTLAPISGNLAQFSYSFVLEEGAVGTVVYDIFMYYNEGSCAERAFKLIFDLKDTTVEETTEEEGE